MKRSIRSAIPVLTLMLLLTGSTSRAAELSPAIKKINPHGNEGDCSLCHTASRDKLNGWFVFGSTKRGMKGDLVSICTQCHGMDFGHGIGKRPSLNKDNLSLAPDGTITCATTCHNMHISGTGDLIQEKYHMRLPHGLLCLSCHDK